MLSGGGVFFFMPVSMSLACSCALATSSSVQNCSLPSPSTVVGKRDSMAVSMMPWTFFVHFFVYRSLRLILGGVIFLGRAMEHISSMTGL